MGGKPTGAACLRVGWMDLDEDPFQAPAVTHTNWRLEIQFRQQIDLSDLCWANTGCITGVQSQGTSQGCSVTYALYSSALTYMYIYSISLYGYEEPISCRVHHLNFLNQFPSFTRVAAWQPLLRLEARPDSVKSGRTNISKRAPTYLHIWSGTKKTAPIWIYGQGPKTAHICIYEVGSKTAPIWI